MFKLRFAILGAAAALALGTASALAMQETAGGSADPDSHGDAVSSAARVTCPLHASGVRGAHGKCVSAIARTNGESNSNGAATNPARTCKAADTAEDSTENAAPAPTKAGRQAANAADRTEDRSEHQAFATCVSGQASGGSGS